MPANLTPEYYNAEDKYRSATTPQEKMIALQEMLKTIPKHKGTEKLQAEIKKKISDLKKQATTKKGKKKGISYHVDSFGNPQVVVIGPPNCGKSLLIMNLSGVEVKVAEYPFTTRLPQPAIMNHKHVQIQLVDTPPFSISHVESWLPGIVRNGDLVLVVLDLANNDILEELENIINKLEEQKVFLKDPKDDYPFNAVKKTLFIANKIDTESSGDTLEIIKEFYGDYEIFEFSALIRENEEKLKNRIYDLLEIIRVYPKPPGKKEIDFTSPIVLKKGSTVIDLADSIHHELAENLKTAKIWESKKYLPGQSIPKDFVLEDGNVVELDER